MWRQPIPYRPVLTRAGTESPRVLRKLHKRRGWSDENSEYLLPEARECAGRMVEEHRQDYPSLWATS